MTLSLAQADAVLIVVRALAGREEPSAESMREAVRTLVEASCRRSGAYGLRLAADDAARALTYLVQMRAAELEDDAPDDCPDHMADPHLPRCQQCGRS